MEFRSVADVPTGAAARYAKQLLSHLGPTVAVEAIEGEPQAGRLVFDYGTATVVPGSAGSRCVRPPPTPSSLARVQDVVTAIWSGSRLTGQLSSIGGPIQSDDAVRVPRHASSSFALNRVGSLMYTA